MQLIIKTIPTMTKNGLRGGKTEQLFNVIAIERTNEERILYVVRTVSLGVEQTEHIIGSSPWVKTVDGFACIDKDVSVLDNEL